MKAIDFVDINELKIVYFDVDGVLSVPRYAIGENGRIVSFSSPDKWDPFVKDNPDAYKDCFIPKAIIEWMEKLKAANIPIKILSASTPNAQPSKYKFLKENYSDLISEVVLTNSAQEKVPYMLKEAITLGFKPFEIALVEDNQYTLFEASEYGFMGIHISWFLDRK